jgi:cell division protein FtsB
MGLNACATLHSLDSNHIYRQNQDNKLGKAIKLQNEGKISAAAEALIALCKERGVPGVTDEALFRLSLLYLGNGLDIDKDSLQLARQSIERLRNEYPTSSWTGMIAPVAGLLTNTAELRLRTQNYKTQIQTLSKENQVLSKENQGLSKENQGLSKENQGLSKETQELRENIEKLKRLDLEIEQERK